MSGTLEELTHSTGGNDGTSATNSSGGTDSREQDRHLPIANIIRIMKKALPKNAKVAKDAKDTISDCVSEFISFITMEASEKCQSERRKTINGEDIITAMENLGFDPYLSPLKLYLEKYRESEKSNQVKKRKGAMTGSSAGLSGSNNNTNESLDEQDSENIDEMEEYDDDQDQLPPQHQQPLMTQQELEQMQQQQQQQHHHLQHYNIQTLSNSQEFADERSYHIYQQQQQQQIQQQQQQQQQQHLQFQNHFHGTN